MDGETDSSSRVDENDQMLLGFGDDCIVRVFSTDCCCDKGADGETDSSSRLEEDNEMILGFDGVTGNSEKGATGRFIAGICLDNADCIILSIFKI